AAKVRPDLVLGQLPIPLGSAGRDIAGRLPLVDAFSHEFDHGHLGPVDLGSIRLLRNQPLAGFLSFAFAVAVFELVPAPLSLAAIEYVDDAVPLPLCAPLANMSAHFFSPSSVSTEGSVSDRLAAARSIAAFRASAFRALASSTGSGNPR